MKKKLFIITSLLISAAVLSLSSCLKDNRYVNFADAGTIVDFNLGGLAYFSQDAITEKPDSDANGTIVRQFAVTVASSTPPKTATVITLGVNNSLIAIRNAADTTVTYTAMPTDAYSFTNTTVTIPAGQTTAIVSVTFYKNKLDNSTSYMLPISILKAPYTISANMGTHYYHFIGNVFSGAYTQTFQRWNAADSTSAALNGASFGVPGAGTGPQTATLSPVSPTEFTAYTGYDGGTAIRYDVKFTKTGTGAATVYTNFNVTLVAADVSAVGPAVTIAQQPVFYNPATGATLSATLPGPYTFAQAQKIFFFQFEAMTTAPRYLKDAFYQ